MKEELSYAMKQINLWYRKSEKTLSIFTIPFHTALIFKDIILELVAEQKKILYIWGKNGENKELADEIRKLNQGITCVDTENTEGNCQVNFTNYKNLEMITGEYELAILDDVSCFSDLDKGKVLEYYDHISRVARRIILYTIEEVVCDCAKIDMVPAYIDNPFVEPRFINTRVDLSRDIPYILYEYLEWFIKNKMKIMILVPDEEKLNAVYEYYTKKLKLKRINIIPLFKKEDKKVIKNVLMQKQKATIIITDSMEETLEDSKIGNVVVLFADSKGYSYKKLLYLCGEIGRVNKKLPEVLFVSKDVSEDMDKVKSITRDFNKRKWEKKLKLL